MVEDIEILFGKKKDNLNDFSDCPCNLNCPDGCSDCPNSLCVCGEHLSPENNHNLDICIKKSSIDLGKCVIACNNDFACENYCVDRFKAAHEQCPCQVN